MKLLAFAFVLTLLSGCQTFDTSTKKIEAACASATSSIQIVTLYKDKLSDTQRSVAAETIGVLQPVCGDRENIPTLTSAKQAAIDSAVAKLLQLATEVRK